MHSNAITAEVDLVFWKVGRDLVRGGQVRDLETEVTKWVAGSRTDYIIQNRTDILERTEQNQNEYADNISAFKLPQKLITIFGRPTTRIEPNRAVRILCRLYYVLICVYLSKALTPIESF